MTAIPVEHGIVLAAILFAIGMVGLLSRRNTLFVLLSLEVMLNASGLAFVCAGSYWQQADGQVMYIFILTLAAAEVSLALALLLQLRKRYGSLDLDLLSRLRG
ncbi:MAG: NADH-quinone oxidoreductase subunit NuoK [Aestuariibacter sp.]